MSTALAGTELNDPATVSSAPASQQATRFTAVDVYIDSGAAPLAVYQFELLVNSVPEAQAPGDEMSDSPQPSVPQVKIVGIEGGDHAAFRDPPYYDPGALNRNRIIIAAFSTAKDLPAGRTRVARLHLQVTGGEPAYRTRIDVAATEDGKPLDADVSISRR